MKKSKGIAIGIMIIVLVVLPLFSAYAAQKQPSPTAAPPTATGKPSQATPALPDLIVERVWLDDKEGFINFQLKNTGQAEIPDREHGRGMVRVTYGKGHEDFSFRKTLKKRPPVDPTGLLKKPGGVVQYNTQIRLEERLTVTVVVDSTKRIAEENEQNNQGVALGLIALKDVRKETAKEVKPVTPPEVRREITQREGLRTLEDEGPGRGAGEDFDLEIVNFYIFQGPRTADRHWGDTAHYTYNGGEEHEDIKFLVQVRNHGPDDFEGSLIITVRSGSAQASDTTSVITIPAEWNRWTSRMQSYEVILHQSELIERGDLSAGRHEFSAQIRPFPDDVNRENNISPDHVTLWLLPAGRAIPKKTRSLSSEPSLTGSVDYRGHVNTHIIVGGGSYKSQGFISFDLSPLREQIAQWRDEGWTGFEIKSATLTLDEYNWWFSTESWSSPERIHEYIGRILFDHLEYGDGLDTGDYGGPMISNLFSFQSADGIHTIESLEAYVRFELERGNNRIQFRLRLVNDDHVAAADFRKPCELTVVFNPKGSVRLAPGATTGEMVR